MRFHHPAIPIVLTALSSIASLAAIIGPLATSQALAFGAERGQPGGAFLLAALLAACALTIVLFGVVRRLKPAGESG